jgi:hypothetical protein
MAKDVSDWPLLALMENVGRWARSAGRDEFWRDRVEHRMWADELRDVAKGIIVWLELRGRDEDAARLEEGIGRLRRALGDLQEACEGVYPPEDPRCNDARAAVIDAADRLAGVAEDLDQEVPEEAWEGFFDV